MYNINVAILGCGITGMMTALSLAFYGIKSTIFEVKDTQQSLFFVDQRPLALTYTTIEICKKIKIWNDVQKVSGAIKDIYVVDNSSCEDMIHFSSEFLEGNDYIGYLTYNREFKKIVFSYVQDNPLITIVDKVLYHDIHNNSDNSEIILSNNDKYRCELIIICDGSQSIAKRKFFSNLLEKNYNQHALLFTITHDRSHKGTAVKNFLPSGPFAILPMQPEHCSFIVWSIKDCFVNSVMNLPQEEFNFFVQRNCGASLGLIKVNEKVTSIPLYACITKQYYNNRLVLVADSAYTIHPLAGQGLNQGIKDIESLSYMINKFGIGVEAFQAYQDARQQDNIDMFMITDTLNTIFSNHSLSLKLIRNIGFKFLSYSKSITTKIQEYAMGKRFY